MRYSVLSPDGVEHIATHEYKAGKYTPLDNLLNPFWLWAAHQLPQWLAPNLVTLMGFLPLVVSFSVSWWLAPHYTEPAPRWLALSTALSVFAYQTFDAMDGKQARRTGSSTPLGQLFDHGCDCLACLSHHGVAAMVLLPGPNQWAVLGLIALQTAFFLAQWQEYHTGVLRTSFGPVGVSETQFMLILGALFAFALGPEQLRVFMTTEIEVPVLATKMPRGHVAVKAWALFMSSLMVICFGKTVVHTLLRPTPSGGLRRLAGALLQLAPVAIFNILTFMWDTSVLSREPRLVCCIAGMLYFYYTVQMIVFSMARMPYPAWQPTLLPYGAVVLLSRLAPPEAAWFVDLALTFLAVAIIAHVLLWVSSVIEELKVRLGIFAFSLTKPPGKTS